MRQKKCPSCDSTNIATILWGLPIGSPELDSELQSKKIVLGGCCVGINDPKWECNDCSFRWGKRDAN